ncbi:MAG: phosphoglycolate phosphatase [Actinomycetota bacterium]|jgi:phosphoglycolate phosphatase|nr:haloacid dehalogenase [Glaciihabitans sp.]MDQ1544258.1 phosphoglycolate phosphatase [Actinomycetota bacterium]
MAPAFTSILFDLDGTIVDSAPGITSTLAYTFEELGRPVPGPAELLAYVGPPILDSFRERAGMSMGEAAAALAIYRPRYLEIGALDSTVFPGVADVLKAVHAAGIPVSLATSKPETPARLILSHYGLLGEFDVITGASDDEVRSSKADVVAEALVRLAATGADLSRPVLVGDRKHDVEGAAANGIPTIFVDWGYGVADEQAGAIAVIPTPADLQKLLLG